MLVAESLMKWSVNYFIVDGDGSDFRRIYLQFFLRFYFLPLDPNQYKRKGYYDQDSMELSLFSLWPFYRLQN